MPELILTAKEKAMVVMALRREANAYLTNADSSEAPTSKPKSTDYAHDLLALASRIDTTATVEQLLDAAYKDVQEYQSRSLPRRVA